VATPSRCWIPMGHEAVRGQLGDVCSLYRGHTALDENLPSLVTRHNASSMSFHLPGLTREAIVDFGGFQREVSI